MRRPNMSEGRDDDRVTIATALAEIKQLKTEVERIGRMHDAIAQLEGWDALLKALELEGGQ